MSVIRVNKTADYTVMSNDHFKEKEMTLKAKGLLSLMLSLPENWDYSIAGLVTLSKDGKDSVMNALIELEQFGYLKRTRRFDKQGHFAGYDYDIYEKAYSETPYSEKPNTENPPQLNTKELNTKKINNNIIRHKYGEYKNVLLSDADFEKLKNEFPNDYEERIEKLSAYMASTGKVYKNHLATIRNWARNDKTQPVKAKSKYVGRNEVYDDNIYADTTKLEV
jgi:hypothetical protein